MLASTHNKKNKSKTNTHTFWTCQRFHIHPLLNKFLWTTVIDRKRLILILYWFENTWFSLVFQLHFPGTPCSNKIAHVSFIHWLTSAFLLAVPEKLNCFAYFTFLSFFVLHWSFRKYTTYTASISGVRWTCFPAVICIFLSFWKSIKRSKMDLCHDMLWLPE